MEDSRVGRRVRDLRRRLGLTQKELAERCGLSPVYVQFIESGKRHPSLKALSRIAEALGVELDDLFVDEDMSRVEVTEIFSPHSPLRLWYRGRKLSPRQKEVLRELIERTLEEWRDDEGR